MNIENKINSINISEAVNFNQTDFENHEILNQINLNSKNVNGTYLYLKDEFRYNIKYPLYKHEKYDFWIKIKKKANNLYWVLFIPSKYDDVLNIEIILYKSPIITNISTIIDGPINHQFWIPNWNLNIDRFIPTIKINRILELEKIKNNSDLDNIKVNLSKPLHIQVNLNNPIEGIYTKIDSNIYININNNNYFIINDLELNEWKLVKIDTNYNILAVFFYISHNNSVLDNFKNIPLYIWTLKNIEKNSEGIEQYDIPLLDYINLNGYQTIEISKY